MRNKQGTFFYSNGSKYEGEWKDNLKHGYGVFTFEDGSIYRGPFEKDRMANAQLNSKQNGLKLRDVESLGFNWELIYYSQSRGPRSFNPPNSLRHRSNVDWDYVS